MAEESELAGIVHGSTIEFTILYEPHNHHFRVKLEDGRGLWSHGLQAKEVTNFLIAVASRRILPYNPVLAGDTLASPTLDILRAVLEHAKPTQKKAPAKSDLKLSDLFGDDEF